MSAVVVRVRGKRGTFTLPGKPTLTNPLLDRAATDSDRVFGKRDREPVREQSASRTATSSTSTTRQVADLLKRLRVQIKRQAAATSSVNRKTIKNRAGKLRKKLRLLGVENPPDSSSACTRVPTEGQR